MRAGAATPAEAPQGDCIDCMACVNVCPMGIDIRDGQQMECITCGLCIDACDDMMDKLGRPRGLIGYFALTDETAERAGGAPEPVWRHVLRPADDPLHRALGRDRASAWSSALFMRAPRSTSASTPVRNPVFVTLSDGDDPQRL